MKILSPSNTADFVIIGAGIIGLTVALELRNRYPDQSIVILEKESGLGCHASGRNSGVLHSGIYYPENTLKAKLCADGAKMLSAYCEENKLPINRVGKVIVPVKTDQDELLDILCSRGRSNQALVEIIDSHQLKEIEPEAYSITGRALHSPNTAVFNPIEILNKVADDLQQNNVTILFNQRIRDFNGKQRSLLLQDKQIIKYGYLFNTAGLYADKIAKSLDIGRQYTIIPFKGLYSRLIPDSDIKLNGHVYPVPDLNMPFLGVHFTKSIQDNIYIGPTAIPALGRENYHGLSGINLSDLPKIGTQLLRLYLKNEKGFQHFAHQEIGCFYKPNFVKAAQALLPRLTVKHIMNTEKVGIRAQLLDLQTMSMVMDFLVEKGEDSTHILNAVSPAFTSSFSFARYVLDHYGPEHNN